MFYPDIFIDSITSLNVDYLKRNGIKGLIVDMDNTIINHKANIKIEGLENWIKEMKKEGINIVIVTNSVRRNKVRYTSKYYDIPFIYIALKPTAIGINLGKKKLGLKSSEIAVVGDQIFTDIFGANLKGMHSILVKPIKKKRESFMTRIFRKFEKKIINKYLENNEIKTKESLK